jgi:cytochrome P450
MQIPEHVPPELVRRPPNEHVLDADPYVGMQALREFPPIFYTPVARVGAQTGHWVVTSAEVMKEVMRDAERFSSHAIAGFSMLLGEHWPLVPLEIDPPLQTEFRRAMAPLLAPGRVKSMEPDIRELATRLIDNVVHERRCDFVKSFGTPLPVVIFMRLMGMELDRLDVFLRWEHDLLHSGDPAKRVAAAKSIHEFVLGLIDERQARPGDDLVSAAVQMEVAGRRLTRDEILGMSFLFFVGGLDTVAATLGYIFRYLATHPEDRSRLAKDSSLIPDAIEELMRRHSVVSTRRMATRDVELSGVTIKRGEYIECDLGLAGTDPEVFPDPLAVDITRKPNPHIGFGIGPHRCFGSNLARAEMRIGIEEWLARIPDFHVAADAELHSHFGVRGLDALPLTW